MPPAEPIVLVPPSVKHKQLFEEERLHIALELGRLPAAIEHIGSTAIAGIAAKPIVDILVGLRSPPLTAAIAPLQAVGYEPMASAGAAERLVFRKAEPRDVRQSLPRSEQQPLPRTFHVHVVLFDGAEWRRHIIFRDWLNLHPPLAKEYEALKVSLAERFANDRPAYTDGKTAFVERVLAEAAKFPALRLAGGLPHAGPPR